MNQTKRLSRGLAALAFALSVVFASSEALAADGTITITSNTNLGSHQNGAIIFGADNITLDCQGLEIRLSATHTTNNCGASNSQKCGIVAVGRSNVHIRNCSIVGGFAYGAFLRSTTNSSIVWSQSTAQTGFRFEANTNLTIDALDANYCALGGYELRDNVNTKVYYTWATGVGGDGFDENNGTSTDYYRDTRATGSGVNGYECDGCLDIMYGYPGTTYAGMLSHSNGQHGISVDDSQSVYVWHGSILWNAQDGVRFQGVSNAAGYHFSDFYVSSSFGNAGCDCRSDSSPGDQWDLDDCGSACGNFWD
jgi:hypothetical protein